MIKLFARYMSVGVVNTLIHWLVFTGLFILTHSQSLSNLLAFCAAVTFSFYANAKWTFNAQATTFRYIIYVLFLGALATLTGWSGDHFAFSPVITLVGFSIISLIGGFIYSKFIVFKERI